MADLNRLSQFTFSLSALSNLVLVRPVNVGYQPQSEDETDEVLPNFLFTYEGVNTAVMTSDITDHFIEDNTPIHDHIALRPETITVRGYVGELTSETPLTSRFFRGLEDKLTALDFFAPEISSSLRSSINNAARVYGSARRIANRAVESVFNMPLSNKQQRAFDFFYGYWSKRRLFEVQTPWKVFTNMAINKIETSQPEGSPSVTNFELEFKKINFVSPLFLTQEQANKQGRLKGQTEPPKNFKEIVPSIEVAIDTALNKVADVNPFIRRPREE